MLELVTNALFDFIVYYIQDGQKEESSPVTSPTPAATPEPVPFKPTPPPTPKVINPFLFTAFTRAKHIFKPSSI